MKSAYGKGRSNRSRHVTHSCDIVKTWDKKRRALKTLHAMYLEDIEEGSLDEGCPMGFAEFIQSEYENIKGQNEDWVRESHRTGFFIQSEYENIKEHN